MPQNVSDDKADNASSISLNAEPHSLINQIQSAVVGCLDAASDKTASSALSPEQGTAGMLAAIAKNIFP